MTNQPPYNQPPGGYPPQPNQPPPYGYPPPQPPYGYPSQPNQPMPGVSFSPPPPPMPPKKSKVGLIIGIVLGFFALLIVAAVIGFVFLFSSASSAKTDGEKVVTDFMTAFSKGDVRTAHSLLAPDFRQELSQQTMQRQLEANSFIESFSGMSFTGFSYNANNGVETVQMSGKANFGTTGSSNVEFVLRKVSGEEWRLTKYSIRPPA
jgi:hypothetical protein